MVFYGRHVCRLDPWPPEVVEAFAWLERDPTVHHTMNGPTEFHVVGLIKDWQSKDRLASIEVPTLLVSGRHDEATPALHETLQSGIPDAAWVLFEESSHMPTSGSASATCRSLASGLPGTTGGSVHSCAPPPIKHVWRRQSRSAPREHRIERTREHAHGAVSEPLDARPVERIVVARERAPPSSRRSRLASTRAS